MTPEHSDKSETAGSPRDPYPLLPTDSKLEPFIQAIQERRRWEAEKKRYPFLDTDSSGKKWINFQYVAKDISEVTTASPSKNAAEDEEPVGVFDSLTLDQDQDHFESGTEEAADSLWEGGYSPSERSHEQWLREEDQIHSAPSVVRLLEEEWVEGLHD